MGFPGGSVVKNLPASSGDVGLIPGLESLLEKEMAAYSRAVACSHGQRSVGVATVHGVAKSWTRLSD